MNLILVSHQFLSCATLSLIVSSRVMLVTADKPDAASAHESVKSPRPFEHTLQSLDCQEEIGTLWNKNDYLQDQSNKQIIIHVAQFSMTFFLPATFVLEKRDLH